MLVDILVYYIKNAVSIKEFKRIPIQNDQKNLLIPPVGSTVRIGQRDYKVLEVVYNYDLDQIEILIKKIL